MLISIFILFRNLLFLKNYSGNVEDLSLNFTVVNNDLGESQVSQTKQPNSTTPFNKLWFPQEDCWIFYISYYRSIKLLGVFLTKVIALEVGGGRKLYQWSCIVYQGGWRTRMICSRYCCIYLLIGCRVEARWSRYPGYQQQPDQLYSPCGWLQTKQTSKYISILPSLLPCSQALPC